MSKLIIYTATDFAQYHAGNMPLHDMYMLEKAALEDPFLADALEGYTHTKTAKQDVEILSERLNKKTKSNKLIFFTTNKKWLSIAASVAFIVGIGYLFFSINNKTNIAPLAKNENLQNGDVVTNETKIDSSIVLNTITNTGSASHIERVQFNKLLKDTSNQLNFAATEKVTPNKLNTTTYWTPNATPAAVIQNEVAPKAEDASKDFDDKNTLKKSQRSDANVLADSLYTNNNNIALNKESEQYKTQNGFSNNFYNYSGVVKSPTGGPMQNATLKINNTNLVTQTDKYGRFNFKATDSVANVSIAATGFDNKVTQLNATNSETIKMNYSFDKLSEVVVVGYGAKAKKQPTSAISTTNNAQQNNKEPQQISEKEINNIATVDLNKGLQGKVAGLNIGKSDSVRFRSKSLPIKKIDFTNRSAEQKRFYEYVNKNAIPVFDKKGNPYKGTVVLSFLVNKKGNPRKIKVEKSLNNLCDAEAKRLLENGPLWIQLNGDRNYVEIQF